MKTIGRIPWGLPIWHTWKLGYGFRSQGRRPAYTYGRCRLSLSRVCPNRRARHNSEAAVRACCRRQRRLRDRHNRPTRTLRAWARRQRHAETVRARTEGNRGGRRKARGVRHRPMRKEISAIRLITCNLPALVAVSYGSSNKCLITVQWQVVRQEYDFYVSSLLHKIAAYAHMSVQSKRLRT